MTDVLKTYAYERRRQRDMRNMIDAAERKLVGLYREAERYRQYDILRDRSYLNEAWDREVAIAKLEAFVEGRDYTIGPR